MIIGGTLPALQGEGDVTVEGPLELPAGASLSIRGSRVILETDGAIPVPPPPGPREGPLLVDPLCPDLLPVFPPEQREVGRFRLEAAALPPAGGGRTAQRGHSHGADSSRAGKPGHARGHDEGRGRGRSRGSGSGHSGSRGRGHR